MKREEPIIIIKKKKGGHAAHHGGAWKVAYADFVTAMMALFIVLWLLSQTDQTMRQQLSAYFRTGVFSGAPSVMNGGSGVRDNAFVDPKTDKALQSSEQSKLDDAARQVRAAVAELAAQDPKLKELISHVDVRVTDFGLLIQLLDGDGGDDTLFEVSSSELKPALITLLKRFGPLLGRLSNQLQVHGHTDARPFPAGSNRSNWGLSFERADRARGVLEKAGVREGQITGVFAHGSNAPLVKDPFASKNRRLAILAVRRGLETTFSYGAGRKTVM
jgi:chemotaxis protein MotB